MLTDEELTAAANRYLRKVNGESGWIADLHFMTDPPGGWAIFRHESGEGHTGGPTPFFIDREDGFITDLNRGAMVLLEWVKAGLPSDPTMSPVMMSAWVKHMLHGSDPRYSHLRPPTIEELRLALDGRQ